MLKLNLGAGEEDLSHAPAPWVNIDIRPSTQPHVVADIRHLPFPDRSASHVYAGHVLEHLPFDDVLAALMEARRVLMPEGRLLAVGPDIPSSLVLHAAGKITDERLHSNRQHGEPGNVCVHQWDCSGVEVARLLSVAGFEVVAQMPIADTPMDFPVFDRGTPDQFAVLAR